MISYWGPYTWVFMHSFFSLMSDQLYLAHRGTVVRFVIRICRSLPCDECRMHATRLTRNISPQSIPTRRDMIRFLMNFHNSVNRRLGKPQFADIERYERSKLGEVFVAFQNAYLRKVRMALTLNMVRHDLVKEIREFIVAHQGDFTILR
jgi:hypothetical protein